MRGPELAGWSNQIATARIGLGRLRLATSSGKQEVGEHQW
jgi:hypothetical protein